MSGEIIVIEGAPGSGKTTLASYIQAQVPHTHIYAYKRPTNRYELRREEEILETLIKHRRMDRALILDRIPAISQKIFAPYTFSAEPNPISDYPITRIIYCEPGLAEIRKNREGTRFYPHLSSIREAYKEEMVRIMKSLPIRVSLWDYTTGK